MLRLMFATRPIVVITPRKAARFLVMNKPPVAVNRQGNHRDVSGQMSAGFARGRGADAAVTRGNLPKSDSRLWNAVRQGLIVKRGSAAWGR
ncbi:MAG: hypothetical protein M3Q74_04260, partial [Pseudomonadota bacterium]|nr:hypothetical protein [Pseudomonadota bacterium]